MLALALGVALPAAADLDEVKRRGVLRAVTTADVPEFFFLKDGQPAGIDVELLEGFVRLHRVTLDFVITPRVSDVLPALLDGRGDIIAGGLTVTEQRAREIDFTAETFPTRFVVVTRKPQAVVQSIDQLRQMRVGTVKGSGYSHAVAGIGIPPDRVDDGIAFGGFGEALRTQRVHAVVWAVEDVFRAQREDPDLQIGMFIGPPGSLAFGVRKGETQLKDALSSYVQNVRRTATWSRLVVKYYGQSALDILKMVRPGEEP